MKKFLLASAVLALVACSKVPAGYVGVKVYLLGGAKGVDTEILGVGRYWIGINEELYKFPTYQVNTSWTKEERQEISFQTKEGMVPRADSSIPEREMT